MERKPPKSRWSRDPVLNTNGEPIVIDVPIAIDKAIFNLLHPERRRRLPTSYFPKLLGRNYWALVKRLNVLQSEPNYWLVKNLEQKRYVWLSRDQLYELDNRALKWLEDQGLLDKHQLRVNEPDHIVHDTTIDLTWAALECDFGDKYRMVLPREISQHKNFKGKPPRPFDIPDIKISHPDLESPKPFAYRSDGIRGIEHDGVFHFLNLEVETLEKPVTRTNLTQRSFRKTFLSVQYIMENKLYKTHWGMPRLMTLIVTPTASRIDSMINTVVMPCTNGKGAPWLLFASFPFLDDLEAPLKPFPLLSTPLRRAGYPSISIEQYLQEVTNGHQTEARKSD